MMKSYLNINSLILVGVRKNYVTTFYKGLNVIYGDSDTGKSSILEFINYLLGASSIDLADEIKTSVNYAALEVVINDTVFTIVRDIYDHKKAIEVYRCKFDDLHKHFPKNTLLIIAHYQMLMVFFRSFYLIVLIFQRLKLRCLLLKLIHRCAG